MTRAARSRPWSSVPSQLPREGRDVKAAVVANEQRPVVGDQFGAEAQQKQDQENPERPEAAPVLAEVAEPAAREGADGRNGLDLPGREVDARVDSDVGQVADQVQEQADQRVDVERPEHDRVVSVDRRFEAEQPKPVEGEDDLDQKGSREEDADEGG